jgi:hypothetical protein
MTRFSAAGEQVSRLSGIPLKYGGTFITYYLRNSPGFWAIAQFAGP